MLPIKISYLFILFALVISLSSNDVFADEPQMQQASDSDSLTEQQENSSEQTAIVELPTHPVITGKVFIVGIGLDIGLTNPDRSEYGVIFTADSTILGGWLSGGFYYKSFYSDSFFITQELAYYAAAFDSYSNDGFGYGFTLGNQWKVKPNTYVGAEWGGIGLYHTGSKFDVALHFPKIIFSFHL